MWKMLFQPRYTTKVDIWLAVGAIAIGIVKLADAVHQYKTEQEALNS